MSDTRPEGFPHLPRDSAARRDAAGISRSELVRGLRNMGGDFSRFAEDFTFATGQRLIVRSLPERVQGLIEVGGVHHQFGLDTMPVTGIIERSGGGVSVSINTTGEGDGDNNTMPGLIVGLVGARYNDRNEVFDGVAIVPDYLRNPRLVAVGIRPDGSIFLHPLQYDPSSPDLLSRSSVADIFPPRHLAVERRPK